MQYERRLWLAVTPWSQVVGRDGYAWTVLPHWPAWQKRITRKGRDDQTFTPELADMASVLVPDKSDAMAALVASFGVPEVIAWRDEGSVWWVAPQPVASTVLAHLRDWHGTLKQGSPSARITHTDVEALAYHWQLHQQQLVFPLPDDPHTHT